MGGHWFEELFGDPNTVSEDRLVEAALESLHIQLGINASPDQCMVSVLKVSSCRQSSLSQYIYISFIDCIIRTVFLSIW